MRSRFDQRHRATGGVLFLASRKRAAKLAPRYPTLVILEDGSLWFSRMKEDDVRLASSYESAYGWYIPGDPNEALSAIVLCCRLGDLNVASGYFQSIGSMPSGDHAPVA